MANLENIWPSEVAQKAKVSWIVEGDENSSFFHGMLKKRRHQMLIRGIFLDGDWVHDHLVVKKVFYEFYAAKC